MVGGGRGPGVNWSSGVQIRAAGTSGEFLHLKQPTLTSPRAEMWPPLPLPPPLPHQLTSQQRLLRGGVRRARGAPAFSGRRPGLSLAHVPAPLV